MHVLVVEDVSVTREVLSAVAHAAIRGAVVTAAASLEQALICARSAPRLDLVLLDLGLPGCRGLDALVRLRAIVPDAKVIVVSADESSERVAAVMGAGAIGFVGKRGIPRDVFAAIQAVARRSTAKE